MNAWVEQYKVGLIIATLAVLMLAAGAVGWGLNGWRLAGQVADAKTETANERTSHQSDLAAISNAAAQQVRDALAKQQDAQKAMAELDRKQTEELKNAKDENDRLRGDVAAGRRRLQLKAICPANSGSVPAATGAAGLGNAAGPRLDDAAERDYWRLLDGITTATNQIATLQQYINAGCRPAQ